MKQINLTLPTVAILITLCFGCTTKTTNHPLEYTGPLREADEMVMYYTEDDLLKVQLKTKKILEFANGNQEFPSGIFIEFYDESGVKKSDLKANHATYFKDKNQWVGRGNVIVRNLLKNEQLTTEELYWSPEQERIFTEKFVTINLSNEILYGTGLDAKQDMSTYTIKKPAGEFELKE